MPGTIERDSHVPEGVSEKAGADASPSAGGPILRAYTVLHVVISLVAIACGLVVLGGMLGSLRMDALTAVFLWTTLATSVTGFFFPFKGFKPSYVVGILSCILLTFALLGRYSHGMAGHWRGIYVGTAVAALYLNVFVLIVQSFQKIPALHRLAPTQSERPFAVTQITALALFALLGTLAATKFHP